MHRRALLYLKARPLSSSSQRWQAFTSELPSNDERPSSEQTLQQSPERTSDSETSSNDEPLSFERTPPERLPGPPPPPDLPPHKLRALISLYHAAAEFPKPSNLDKYIDLVLVPFDHNLKDSFATMGVLNDAVAQRRTMPSMAVPGRERELIGENMDVVGLSKYMSPEGFSKHTGVMSPKNRKVRDALLGLESRPSQPGALASLEVVREAELEGGVSAGGLGVKLRGKRPLLDKPDSAEDRLG